MKLSEYRTNVERMSQNIVGRTFFGMYVNGDELVMIFDDPEQAEYQVRFSLSFIRQLEPDEFKPFTDEQAIANLMEDGSTN
jgi:hypothetical protein